MINKLAIPTRQNGEPIRERELTVRVGEASGLSAKVSFENYRKRGIALRVIHDHADKVLLTN